jgi:ATP-dependent DNA helicase RecG
MGVKNASRLLQDIPNKVRAILGIMVGMNLVEEAGNDTLEIVVEPYPSPVSYKGEYHYRSGSTKQELKGAALDRFLLRKQGRH